jgi:hypothetical protein
MSLTWLRLVFVAAIVMSIFVAVGAVEEAPPSGPTTEAPATDSPNDTPTPPPTTAATPPDSDAPSVVTVAPSDAPAKTASLTIVVPPSTTKTVSPDTDNVTDAPNETEDPDPPATELMIDTTTFTFVVPNDPSPPPPPTPPTTDNVSTAPASTDATINDKSDDEEGMSAGGVVVLIVVILVVLGIAVGAVVYFVRKGKPKAAGGQQKVPGLYATVDDEMQQGN